MERRRFLGLVAAAPLLGNRAFAAPDPDDLKKYTINRITGFRHAVGRAGGGEPVPEDVLRIGTDVGVEGIGLGRTTPGEARALLGHSLDEFWRPKLGVVSPLGRSDQALYDLVGQALGVPTWQVLGGQGRPAVPAMVRVGFDDLLPAAEGRSGVARLVHEVGLRRKAGHRAFLIRVGRGHDRMDPEAGLRRDVEVVKAVRKALDGDARIMATADGVLDLETAERLLDAVGDVLDFVDAPFPTQVDRNLLLKDHLRAAGARTLVAGGESAEDLGDYDALLAKDALDIYRPDVRTWGLTRLAALARKLSIRPRIGLAPSHSGSVLGLVMQLVLARAVPNFLIAEDAQGRDDLFDASAYPFKDGAYRVPDIPGLGVTVREDVFRAKYAADAWVVR